MLPRINAQDSWRGGNGRAERIEASWPSPRPSSSCVDVITTQEGTGDGGQRGRGDDDDGDSEHHERRMKNAMKTRRMNDEVCGCSI